MTRFAALLAGLVLAAAPAAQAQVWRTAGGPDSLGADYSPERGAPKPAGGQRLLPLNVIIERIQKRTPGTQLDTGTEYMGDRPVYRVRWITKDGRRIDYLIDAVTGAILSGG
ncbi:MAG TPA: PepSY domain-containing protein [Caulobacteraceae bacterium]|nr:PepSY domain-containing protein [Caulobacteraceae bacterium]